jgi:hypothetical protein
LLSALGNYVGVRHEKKSILYNINLKDVDSLQNKKKDIRGGAFTYIAETSKIINYSSDGIINVFPIDKNNL